MSRQYIDAAAFTALFRQRRRNHAQICIGLQLIASGVARRFWFRTPDDRQDVSSSVLLYAIERINRFKLARGADAFNYYSTLINNRIMRVLREKSRDDGRATLFTDCSKTVESYEVARWYAPIAGLDNTTPYARASR